MKNLFPGFFLAVSIAVGAPSAQAAYPTQPITIVVPAPPGGSVDIGARILAQQLSQLTGQSVIVDNRPGKGGAVGVDVVKKAAADGYTILMRSNAVQVGPEFRRFGPLARSTNPAASIQYLDAAILASTPKDIMDELARFLRADPERS